MRIVVKSDFERWALGHSGMIGNINAPYWFFGIEFGGGDKESRKPEYFTDEYNKHLDKPTCVDIDFKNKYNDYRKWPVWRRISKIVLAIKSDSSDPKHYQRDSLFNEQGETFLMNLYPLDFSRHDDTFEDVDIKMTGLNDRDEYSLWCRLNRFPILRELFIKSNAKCLICFGKRNWSDFLSVFQANDINEDSLSTEDINGHRVIYFSVNGKQVFLIPFLGQGGFKSDADLSKLGELIRSKI